MTTVLTQKQLEQVRTVDVYKFTMPIQHAMQYAILGIRNNNIKYAYDVQDCLAEAVSVGKFKNYVKNMEHAVGDSKEVSAYFSAFISVPLSIVVKRMNGHLTANRAGDTEQWFTEPDTDVDFCLTYEDTCLELLAALRDQILTSFGGIVLMDDFCVLYGALKLSFNPELHHSRFKYECLDEILESFAGKVEIKDYQLDFIEKVSKCDEESYELYCNLIDLPDTTSGAIVQAFCPYEEEVSPINKLTVGSPVCTVWALEFEGDNAFYKITKGLEVKAIDCENKTVTMNMPFAKGMKDNVVTKEQERVILKPDKVDGSCYYFSPIPGMEKYRVGDYYKVPVSVAHAHMRTYVAPWE